MAISQLAGLHYRGADNIHPVVPKPDDACVLIHTDTTPWQPPAVLTQANHGKGTAELANPSVLLMEYVAYMFRGGTVVAALYLADSRRSMERRCWRKCLH